MKRYKLVSRGLTVATILSVVGTGVSFATTGGCVKDVVDSCCSAAAAQGRLDCGSSCEGRPNGSCCGWTPDSAGNPTVTYTVSPSEPMTGRVGITKSGSEYCLHAWLECKNGNCGTTWIPGWQVLCLTSQADPNGVPCP